MSDFLDALIDRHIDVAPQIVPRLPSIYESEISVGMWDSGDEEGHPEIEQTIHAPPPNPMEAPTPQHVNARGLEPTLGPIATTTSSDSNAEAASQEQNASFSAKPAAEKIQSRNADVSKPAPSVTAEARGPDEGFRESLEESQPIRVPRVTTEAHKDKREVQKDRGPRALESRRENQTFVRVILSEKEGDTGISAMNEPVSTRPPHEEKSATDSRTPSIAPPIFPRELNLTHAHREERHQELHSEIVDNRPLAPKGAPEAPAFASAPEKAERDVAAENTRPTPTLPKRERAPSHGLLNPPSRPIAQAIPTIGESERSTAQSEPVINVTIGRVEVRATMPPQKQSTQPPKRAPTMGLDEYLRRRSGGREG